MKLVAGIDIGNATTETALARLENGRAVFLASGTVPTTGIKGTRQNINGIFHSLNNALEKAGYTIQDLSEVRLNEAAPVIGDVAMETITETIITESTMIGHNPATPGGMGVGVSLDRLAGAVAACGGMGTISTAVCGFDEPDFATDPKGANLRALAAQVRRAKEAAHGAGLVAINAMVATTQYAESVRTALRAGVDAVVCGAGLPRDLPAIAAEVPESDAALAPVVSGGRAAGLICRLWDKHHHRIPDFLVLEGPLAGGKYGRDIPVFVAGGIADGAEMARYMKEGAAGAQFATRFIATEECDASPAYKQRLLDARDEDIAIVQSPVGLPGRALRSPLIERVEAGSQPAVERCMKCLSACDYKTAPYCISRALIAAVRGDWENGLFFCGAGAGKVNRLSTVRAQMEQIMSEWRAAQ